jgi:hypothetical protein
LLHDVVVQNTLLAAVLQQAAVTTGTIGFWVASETLYTCVCTLRM